MAATSVSCADCHISFPICIHHKYGSPRHLSPNPQSNPLVTCARAELKVQSASRRRGDGGGRGYANTVRGSRGEGDKRRDGGCCSVVSKISPWLCRYEPRLPTNAPTLCFIILMVVEAQHSLASFFSSVASEMGGKGRS